MKQTDLALQQIEIMKESSRRQTYMFQNIFGDDFISRMRSRIDTKSFLSAKVVDDPEPEVPDDLEISNDSDSLKISLERESQDLVKPLFDEKETQTDIKGIQTELSAKSGLRKKRSSRIIKTTRKEPSRDLIEALEKTKKEKQKLERTLLEDSKEQATANNLILLSMKYVEKQ